MTREMRVVPVMVHIEPTLDTLLRRALAAQPQSASNFMRALLIEFLLDSGHLNHELLAAITSGATGQPEPVEA